MAPEGEAVMVLGRKMAAYHRRRRGDHRISVACIVIIDGSGPQPVESSTLTLPVLPSQNSLPVATIDGEHPVSDAA